MAACRSTIERKTPRLRRRRVNLAKKPSTALNQEAGVGVKWKTNRGTVPQLTASYSAARSKRAKIV